MGSDDLFKKRKKIRNSSKLTRGGGKRSPLEKILIVCEGEKTEPNYFRALVQHLRLHTADVVDISGDCDSSPSSVVSFAIDEYHNSKRLRKDYSKVYCVIDKDSHPCYQRSLDVILRFEPKGIFHAITSIPCFEYWLYLHFQYSTKTFNNVEGSSSGEQMEKELKKFMPDYNKNDKSIFLQLVGQLDFAIQNSIRARQEALSSGNDNPSTKIDELVTELVEMKKRFVGE
ncbi:RloB family protein [Rosenbergiella australiborealis]|uniref:RloB family protein n=1 Tax=Rosenbergiella australiborealis TaxID=1544696 RepID=UPI001F4E2D65|nr:RloB family protein [Rosenbergiella australiborealis]